MITSLEGSIPEDVPLSPDERVVAHALAAEENLPRSLRVLRVGDAWLAEADLSRFAYLGGRPVGELSATTSREDIDIWSEKATPERLSRAKSWETLGDALYTAKHWRSAYLAYLVAVRQDPATPVHWSDLAKVARWLGLLKAAQALLRTGLDRDPRAVNCWLELANVFDFALRNVASGNVAYRQILSLGGGTAITPYNYAVNLEKIGDLETAYLCCLRACSMDPTDGKKFARLTRLGTLLGKGDIDYSSWNDTLARELSDAMREGRYPPPLSEHDLQEAELLVRGLPTLEDAAIELSTLPV